MNTSKLGLVNLIFLSMIATSFFCCNPANNSNFTEVEITINDLSMLQDKPDLEIILNNDTTFSIELSEPFVQIPSVQFRKGDNSILISSDRGNFAHSYELYTTEVGAPYKLEINYMHNPEVEKYTQYWINHHMHEILLTNTASGIDSVNIYAEIDSAVRADIALTSYTEMQPTIALAFESKKLTTSPSTP